MAYISIIFDCLVILVSEYLFSKSLLTCLESAYSATKASTIFGNNLTEYDNPACSKVMTSFLDI